MKIKISVLKKIAIYAVAVVIGYVFLICFLGNENDFDSAKDVLLRKNFLVRNLNTDYPPKVFSQISNPQQKGEYALVAYAMATYALTNIAMMKPEIKDEASKAIEKWIRIVLTEELYGFDAIAWGENPLDNTTLQKDRGHIGYYGHLNLMLGAYALLNNDGKFNELHQKVSNAIAIRVAKYSHRHVETYPSETYPADNTVAIASLRIADMTLGTNHVQLINEWIEQTKRLEDKDSGLVVFQIESQTGVPLQTYRGSHVGWNSFFLPLIDQIYAESQFEKFEKEMLIQFPGLSAFKEYPHTILFTIDRDSGPVFFGLGTTASGFSIAGARYEKDKTLLAGLLRLVEFFGISVTKNDERHYLTAPVISDSIILAMKTATPWRPLWK